MTKTETKDAVSGSLINGNTTHCATRDYQTTVRAGDSKWDSPVPQRAVSTAVE